VVPPAVGRAGGGAERHHRQSSCPGPRAPGGAWARGWVGVERCPLTDVVSSIRWLIGGGSRASQLADVVGGGGVWAWWALMA
jgi:hypothetical protein